MHYCITVLTIAYVYMIAFIVRSELGRAEAVVILVPQVFLQSLESGRFLLGAHALHLLEEALAYLASTTQLFLLHGARE